MNKKLNPKKKEKETNEDIKVKKKNLRPKKDYLISMITEKIRIHNEEEDGK